MHAYVNTAIKIARDAGQMMLRSLARPEKIEVFKKGTNDYVTSVDRSIQDYVVDQILTAYPRHGILGEEDCSIAGKDPVQWIIDPIDGTSNFMHQVPFFSISIAVAIKGVVEHGVIFNPNSAELFVATRGQGAQCDNRRLRISEQQNLSESIIALETLATIPPNLIKDACVRCYGSAALELAYVASGRLDGFCAQGLKAWDVAAGVLMVKEAGGYVTDLLAKEDMLSGHLVASTPKVHQQLLNYFG